jgi:hypothetical protein
VPRDRLTSQTPCCHQHLCGPSRRVRCRLLPPVHRLQRPDEAHVLPAETAPFPQLFHGFCPEPVLAKQSFTTISGFEKVFSAPRTAPSQSAFPREIHPAPGKGLRKLAARGSSYARRLRAQCSETQGARRRRGCAAGPRQDTFLHRNARLMQSARTAQVRYRYTGTRHTSSVTTDSDQNAVDRQTSRQRRQAARAGRQTCLRAEVGQAHIEGEDSCLHPWRHVAGHQDIPTQIDRYTSSCRQRTLTYVRT